LFINSDLTFESMDSLNDMGTDEYETLFVYISDHLPMFCIIKYNDVNRNKRNHYMYKRLLMKKVL